MARHSDLWLQKTEAKQVAKLSTLGVSPNFEITVVCGLKFHWYLRTLSLKLQKARTKIEGHHPETVDYTLP